MFLILCFLCESPPFAAMFELVIDIHSLTRANADQFLNALQQLPLAQLEVDVYEDRHLPDTLPDAVVFEWMNERRRDACACVVACFTNSTAQSCVCDCARIILCSQRDLKLNLIHAHHALSALSLTDNCDCPPPSRCSPRARSGPGP